MEKSHEDKVLEDINSIDPMEFNEPIEPERNRLLFPLLASVVILLFILWYIPSYAIKDDPKPRPVDRIEFTIRDIPPRLGTIDEVHLLDVSQDVRIAAIEIGTRACDGNQICYAKAYYYYVRDNINYISDPPTEYIQPPEETLLGAGDCEDQAILLYMLLQSIGIKARIAVIPGHAYLQAYMPDVRGRYKDGEGWVSLDPTCMNCDFGELPPFNSERIIRYV